MALSHTEYSEIIQRQLDGDLTIMIDTPGFRQIMYRADSAKLGKMVGRPVARSVTVIKLLSVADISALLLTSCLAIPAFGLWALLVIPALLVAHTIYKGFVSRGRQTLVGVSILLAIAFAVAIAWPGNPSIWLRAFIVCGALTLFLTRLLYVVTSSFVFSLAHTSYEFFAMFYMQPEGAVVPLLWTDPEIEGIE